MHTIWKGSISFGLVHIPIKLFAATESKQIHLRQLHQECHTPIKYDKVCPVCEEKVDQDEIVKGYEYDKGHFVVLDDDELEAIAAAKSKTIDIIDFIQLKEIDPIYFNRSYFLGPTENGEKAYTLLKRAMEETEKVAMAKFILRAKEQLAAIRVYQKALLIETLHYPDEIRPVDHVPGLVDLDLEEKELKMAKQLIEQLTTDFEPEKYTDEYRAKLKDMIENKITGNEIKIAREVPETDIKSLMDALQESIQQTKKKTKRRRTTKKKAKTS
ncbi:non-homologous end joining protein Ku [Caldalkalibacillus thermarum]|uniref:non-homologous end joining protein Ku n=1 Tax=Caldalkalibacillus thermarum TaxID=296745 RepID=UPI0016641253|nr:Ku protein [Caldalkalibacillus thermarum]GGK14103.1 non-homologous end joining protein Ku [Caldalkalibacillus thermarum]